MLNPEFLTYMPDLVTPRLRLRKLTMRDAADIYRYSRDPEVARHVLWDAHRSIGDSRAYLRYMLRRYRNREPASWAIEYAQTGEVIGTIGPVMAEGIVDVFLNTEFQGGRHQRRVDKIMMLDRGESVQ